MNLKSSAGVFCVAMRSVVPVNDSHELYRYSSGSVHGVCRKPPYDWHASPAKPS